jgi:hypothetical protein
MNQEPGKNLSNKMTATFFSRTALYYVTLVAAFFMLSACGHSSPSSPGTTTSGTTDLQSPATTSSDTTPPQVTGMDPTYKQSDVPMNKTMSVNFSEALNSNTVSPASLFLLSGSFLDTASSLQPVNGAVGYSEDSGNFTANFKPNADLAPETTYTLLATRSITDVAGNGLDRLTYSIFTTEAKSTDDTTPPSVSSTLPANGDSDISVNRAIVATFSEAMKPATITDTSFSVVEDNTKTPVSGNISYSNNSATFTPDAPLVNDTKYIATLSTAVTDLAGNALPADYSWSFTTAKAGDTNNTDTTPPGVSVVTPRNNAIDVAINSAISASFDEALNPATVTASSFTVTGGGSAVSGSVSYNGTTATFKPGSSLATGTKYTATLTTTITDLAGNALAANYSWSFTTAAAAVGDTTPPTVTTVSPVNGAVDVARNSAVSVDFSESLDPATVNTASFILSSASGTVAGSVTYNGTSATFKPLADLQDSTVYTAILTASISDLAGNTLSSNYAWSFTTAAPATPPDTTPPGTVTGSEVPADKATDIAINTAISIAFTESLSPGSVNTSTFQLKGPGNTAVAGSVRYNGTTATFTPLANLQHSATYTATVTSGITDLAGNALPADYSWSFTTATAPDITPPAVVPGTLTPASGATNVPVTTTVSAQFNEALDPSTVTGASVVLSIGGFPVSGSVFYSNNTITFVPSTNLAFNSVYTITINNTVTDLAGNPLTANVSWSFTTERAPANGMGGGGNGGGGNGGNMGGGGGV